MTFNKKGNKKGIAWQTIAIAIITIIVVTLTIFWFRRGGEAAVKGPAETLEQLTGDTDIDGDGVANIFDKCPCDADVGREFTKQKPTKDACTPCQEES
jgi:nucleoside permease NupC